MTKGSSTVQDAVKLGNELITSLQSNESSAEQLKSELSHTLAKWNNIRYNMMRFPSARNV